jgi:hypothetical protein
MCLSAPDSPIKTSMCFGRKGGVSGAVGRGRWGSCLPFVPVPSGVLPGLDRLRFLRFEPFWPSALKTPQFSPP